MTDAEVHAASLAQLEQLQPGTTFQWNNQNYPCLIGSIYRRKNLDAGGWQPESDLVLYVRAALFASVAAQPQLKQTVICRGDTFRIDEITTPAGMPFLRLACNDPNKNG